MQQRQRLNSAPTRAYPMLAAILAVAMVAAAAFGGRRILQVQSAAPADMEVYSATGSFADGANVVVDDAAVKSQGEGDERRVVKEFTRDREFSMVGLTWAGDRDIVAYVRAQHADGSWSPWYLMDQTDPPAGATKFGTEPIYVGPTKRVQVSTGNVDLLEGGRAQAGAATTARDIEAVFLDGGTGTTNGTIKPVADSYTASMPRVITRAQWGAGRSNNPTYTEPVTAATVHHTAGANDYSEAQAPGIVRGIWAYHAKDLGWGDVGYNAMVDKYGNIYEGRAGGLDRAVQGAHGGGFNQTPGGVSVLGNSQPPQPPPAAIAALGQIIGWKAAVAGFDPMGYSYHRAEFDFEGSKYARGQGAMFPNINAHRDFHYNQCPGDNLYARMGDIRAAAAIKYNAVRGIRGVANPSVPRLTNIVNPNGITTAVTPGAGAGTNTAATAAASLSNAISGIASGDKVAIATAAGTLAGVVLIWAFSKGYFDNQIKNVAGTEIISGLTVKDITPLVGPALQLAGGAKAADAWKRLEPSLGEVVGAVSGIGGQELVFYAGGLGVKDAKGEIYALAGEIADAWLQQGLDLGPLGMPTSQAIEAKDGEIRMTFEGGAIVFTPSTKTVNIITN
ncbi:N-acetylmuramoyl-L-alanine amidase [Corynebacterium bouchesdurhonense]|uniref:N-acetylmuramoyl-L-alanine amidase n=1 Tax=Corynebacterium bouchesdurhonense TaxID=1720192 RepID=UPI00083545FF|nr:N-acetylmuramoyl-L-alanine amidase [Corynebacterium bouchesdurhonense]